MSKSFLKISEAYNKLELSGEGTFWIRKSELVATGKCDTTKLSKYGNYDFVVDDDIALVAESWKTIFSFSGTTSGDTLKTMTQDFDSSKSFKISGTIRWNSIPWGEGKAVTIYNTGEQHFLDINVKNNDSTPYMNFSVIDIDNKWITFNASNTYSSIGTSYVWNIAYDAKNKSLSVKIGSIYNETKIVSLKQGIYKLLMLSGSPEWANGDCNVTFTNFKIEVLN